MEKSALHGSFKMAPLPKKEYQFMRAVIQHYTLDSPSELYAILLHLFYEVRQTEHGKPWIINVIDAHRSQKEIEYTLD